MRVDALAGGGNRADAIDFDRLGVDVIRADHEGRELVILAEHHRSIRLEVLNGTTRAGPVELRYRLKGMRDLDAQLLTLRRLVSLARLGRFSATLFPAEIRAARWSAMLRAHDAMTAGARHRELGEALFGEARIASDWRQGSDYLRLQVQRLVRGAEQMVAGGYLELLGRMPRVGP